MKLVRQQKFDHFPSANSIMHNTYDDAQFVSRKLVGIHSSLGEIHSQISGKMERTSADLMVLKEVLSRISTELSAGRPFRDQSLAYEFAQSKINSDIIRCHDSPRIDIQLLAVASTFSWPFLTSTLPNLIKEQPFSTVNIDLLLTEPSVLSERQAGFSSQGTEWAETSRSRAFAAAALIPNMPETIASRYGFNLQYYDSIPHWHGMLINGRHLLLGRANWIWVAGKPNLRLGENTYRYFEAGSDQGDERISLFSNWFQYYKQRSRVAFTHPAKK